MEFCARKTKEALIVWIRAWFEKNGRDCNAVIGISGGKDSSVCAALCVQALGKERVIGVLMPNGTQSDIADSRQLVEYLGIRSVTVNIAGAVDAIHTQLRTARINASVSSNLSSRCSCARRSLWSSETDWLDSFHFRVWSRSTA